MTEEAHIQVSQPNKTSQFVVMVKPVGSLCNLQCSYCYYRNTVYAETGTSGPRMTNETLERFIRQYFEASPGPVVSFVWHGGEPALAGLDFYRLAVDLQKRYLPEGWTCWNSLQTNGTLLNDAWCSFLAEAHFDVGLSIDGTQWIHDQYRKDHQDRGTYQLAKDTVKRLQSHGIQPDLLCTVTAETAKEPLAVYRALRALGTGWIQFIPIVRRDNEEKLMLDSVSGVDYGNFLCSVFDEWVLHDLGQLDVQLFAETMRVWSDGSAGLCWMSPTCGRALIVEQDGGVYSCDHFVNVTHRIGDISSSHLGTLADLPVQRRFGEDKQDELCAQCRSCPWLAVCNGGCPKDRFALSEDGEPGLNHLCAGLKHFFSYIEPAVKIIRSLSAKGLVPDAIMAQLRTMMQSKWKGVGRNDPCPCGSGRKAKNCCWSKRV
ncbi:MAG: anaerobic sulfatase maturase [Treponema sp.]|jgi:uncharacterized protein|nr:anaerobic sulfatase maturase [Treponema sp.]